MRSSFYRKTVCFSGDAESLKGTSQLLEHLSHQQQPHIWPRQRRTEHSIIRRIGLGAGHHASITGGIKSVPSDAQGLMGLVEIASPSVQIKLCVMVLGPAAPVKNGWGWFGLRMWTLGYVHHAAGDCVCVHLRLSGGCRRKIDPQKRSQSLQAEQVMILLWTWPVECKGMKSALYTFSVCLHYVGKQ